MMSEHQCEHSTMDAADVLISNSHCWHMHTVPCGPPLRLDPMLALQPPDWQEVVGAPVGPGRNRLLQVALQLPPTRVHGQLYTALATATGGAVQAAAAGSQHRGSKGREVPHMHMCLVWCMGHTHAPMRGNSTIQLQEQPVPEWCNCFCHNCACNRKVFADASACMAAGGLLLTLRAASLHGAPC
jgi:hypothetical protein